MEERQWIFCPVCAGKTRTQICKETELRFFPLFCPKCKKETLIHVKEQRIFVIGKEEAEDAEQSYIAGK